MHVGDFDQETLYKCMAKEPRAEGVFYKGTVDLTRSMANGDPKLGIRALDTFVAFVVDLAIEHQGKDWKKKTCPIMTEHGEKLINIYAMIGELMKKETTIQYDEKNHAVDFNGQDITREIQIMEDAFQAQDAKKMGFIFADTLYEHLKA